MRGPSRPRRPRHYPREPGSSHADPRRAAAAAAASAPLGFPGRWRRVRSPRSLGIAPPPASCPPHFRRRSSPCRSSRPTEARHAPRCRLRRRRRRGRSVVAVLALVLGALLDLRPPALRAPCAGTPCLSIALRVESSKPHDARRALRPHQASPPRSTRSTRSRWIACSRTVAAHSRFPA